MRPVTAKLASTAAALALMVGSSGASAAGNPAPNSAPDAWVTFSQLNPAGATALAGSSAASSASLAGAAAAAQPAEDSGYRPNPFPWPVAVVLLGVIATAIYIEFIEKHHGRVTFPNPNSPA